MKTNSILIFGLGIILLVTACEKNQHGPGDGAIINDQLSVRLLSEDSRDLLDSEQPDAILQKDIRLYYVVNGEKRIQNHVDADPEKTDRLILKKDADGKYFLTVRLGIQEEPLDEQGRATTILEYTDRAIADTIVTEVIRYAQNITYRHVIYINGKMNVLSQNPTERTVVLRKD